MRIQYNFFNYLKRSAKIQKTFRGYLTKVKESIAATFIQKNVRKVIYQKSYFKTVTAIKKIQIFIKKIQMKTRIKKVVIIQKNYRAYIGKSKYNHLLNNVKLIQKKLG